MKRFCQFVCMLLIFSTALTMPVFAAEEIDQRSSSYFAKYIVYLDKVSDTQLDVWFNVTALDTMDELGASVIKVQRSTDQENWTTMQTFTKESYTQMIKENALIYASSLRYTYSSGYYYRGVITLYAKNSSGYGTLTVTTPTLQL